MKLSTREMRAMQSLPRRLGQRFFELPLLGRLGMDLRGKDVLEIGCGSGYGAFLLNRLHPKSYVGLDVMEQQVRLAKTNYPQFEFLLQDAVNLNRFEDECKDVVVIFGVLHHIPPWRKTIDEIARVLKPAGSLFLEEPRRAELKILDMLLHWEHAQTDFSLPALELHLEADQLGVRRKLWTPLLTMLHAQKSG